MFFYDMLLAIALALLVITLLTPSRRYRGANDMPGWVFLFPLLFLLIWASGAWLTPIGAPVAGVYWLSFVIPAVFLALLLFALAHPSGPPAEGEDVTPTNAAEEAAAGTALAFSVFFWAILIAALVAVIVRYA